MKNDALQTLADQLKIWADALIHSVPGPIRLAETLPEIITENGVVSPPLVLWINRENRIAAGVVLSVRNFSEGVVLAATVTEALAINHAALWLPDALILIQKVEDCWTERANISLVHLNEEGVALARDAFNSLYKELQQCAVTGIILPNKIGSVAIANIFLSLIDTGRRVHERTLLIDGVATVDRERQAISESILDLLLLLQADASQLLPDSLLAEEIEEACRRAVSSFPEDIARVYLSRSAKIDGKTLHRARFRLKQLGLQESLPRIGDALKILAKHFGPDLDCRTVSSAEVMVNPDSISSPTSAENQNCIPARAVDCKEEQEAMITVVAPAPMSLLLFLADKWSGSGRVKGFSVDPFSMHSAGSFSGFFADADKPPANLKRLYQTCLRQSWPTRRFKLPASAPSNIYHLIHLLGISVHAGAKSHTLLSDFDKGRGGMFLLDMLAHVPLHSLRLSEHGNLEIKTTETIDALSSGDGKDDIRVELPDGVIRCIPRVELHHGETTLAVALLPEEIFQLHKQGDLVLASTLSGELSVEHIGLINQFVRSKFGRYLWSELIGGSPPVADMSFEQLHEQRLLIPSVHLLRMLADRVDEAGSSADIDKIVVKRLGLSATYAVQRKRSKRQESTVVEDIPAEKRIEECLSAQGIPSFPSQYCYQFSGIDYDEYEIKGKLVLGSRFLDECDLIDAEGQPFTVTGEERAKALLLVSQGGGGDIRLPHDRMLVKRICVEYLSDLKALRQLAKECGASASSGENFEKTIDTVWQRMGLPPWDIVRSIL